MAQISRPSIAFLAVARTTDRAFLAKCYQKNTTGEERKALDAALAPLLERTCSLGYPGCRGRGQCAGLSTGSSDALSVYALVDAKSLCVAVAGVRHAQCPERVALDMLHELADEPRRLFGEEELYEAKAGSLNGKLRDTMQKLMARFENSGDHDKVTEVQKKVDELKCVMQENVHKILETHTTLEALQNSSESLADGADQFLKNSTTLKRQMWLRNLRVKLISAGCGIAVATYFVLPFIS